MAFNALMDSKTRGILLTACRISLQATYLELTNGKQKENKILSQNLTSESQSTALINSPVHEIVKQASEVKQNQQKKKKYRKQKPVNKTNTFLPECELMNSKMERKVRAEQRMKREMIVSAIKRFWRLRNHLERNPPKEKTKVRSETKQKMKSRNTVEQGTEKEGKNAMQKREQNLKQEGNAKIITIDLYFRDKCKKQNLFKKEIKINLNELVKPELVKPEGKQAQLERVKPKVCHDLGTVDEKKPPDVKQRPQMQIVRRTQNQRRNCRLETRFPLILKENSIIDEMIKKEITGKKRKATDSLEENCEKREMKLRKTMDVKEFEQEKRGMCIQDIHQCCITNLFHAYDKSNFLVLHEEKQQTFIFLKECLN